MSKTKAEIEAEIARLRAKLEHVEIDPAFTPAELVRWDPSLLGAVLHIKHERNIPANAFEYTIGLNYESKDGDFRVDSMYGSSNPEGTDVTMNTSGYKRINSNKCMENIGVLTHEGIRSSIEEQFTQSGSWLNESAVRKHKVDVRNEFQTITYIPFIYYPRSGVTHTGLTCGPGKMYDLSCKELGMTVKKCTNPDGAFSNLILPLANPDRPLLDQIFVATTARIHDTDVVVDKYPLSTLYNEWKRDKAAAPDIMTVCGARRPTVPPLRRTELDKAKEQIAELQAQMRLLLANREADRKADSGTLLSKAAELSKQNERLREALHIAVQTTNATASTNAMDPM
jgi:hypothetical protein